MAKVEVTFGNFFQRFFPKARVDDLQQQQQQQQQSWTIVDNYDQIMAHTMEASERRMVRYNKIGGQTNEQKTSQTRKDTQKKRNNNAIIIILY